MIILHDFVFINLSYFLNEQVVLILKSWQEFLFVFLVSFLVIKKQVKGKKVFVILSLLIILSFYGFILSFINGYGLLETVLNWRMYLLPILIPALIFLNKGFAGINYNILYNYLLILLILLVVFAQYQSFMFDFYNGPNVEFASDKFREEGTIALKKSLWFYDYFGSDHILPRWFNMVRENKIRATSFFVSPIIFAQFLGVLGAIFMAKLAYSRKKLLNVIILMITFYGIYLSQVRAGLIFYFISFLVIFLNKRLKLNNLFILGIPLVMVFITFIGLIVFRVGDSSSLGRLTQYSRLFSEFKVLGDGLGSNLASISFDSLVISVFLAFGVLALLYYKLHLTIINELKNLSATIDLRKKYLGIGLISCYAAYTYVAFFHFSLGSAPIRFIYFISFFFLFQKYNHEKN